MSDPQQPQLQTQPVGGQAGGKDSPATDSTTTDYENAQDADVVAPLASELAHLTGGSTDTHGHGYSHTKTSAYAVDATRHEFLNPAKASQTSPSGVGTASTYLSHDHATNGLLSSNSLRSPSSRKNLHGTSTPSGQSSSGSLHTLAEQEGNDATTSIRRALSTRSAHSHSHTRRHSRSTSVTQPLKRPMNNDFPVYPDQSFAALQAQFHGGRPFPTLRSRSSHPSQNSLYNASHSSAPVSQDRLPIQQAARTADNTPMSSPGLFTPAGSRFANKDLRSLSPQLHHLQAPKETHAAEIDHDLMTGNKIINNYEVIRELGRGEHGKVKLGRDIENDVKVAIKIVSRYSKHRRLGRLGEPQDQTKREVAILKKARHPNVVSLLEVIDDPNKNKVYLVLEFVENGEIIWRRRGVPSIVKINNIRFDAARRGVDLTTEPSEGDLFVVRTAALKHEGLERIRFHNAQNPGYAHYSFEHESDDSDAIERSLSRQLSETNFPTRTHSQDDYSSINGYDLTGSMYGAYDDRQHRPERKYSIATAVSHMSSEPDLFEEDEQFTQVPTLTQDEARRAFRDTLSGLEFLHSIGIIHRDIKPSNLLIGVGGIVKISDFGVSYLGRPLTEEEAEVKTAEKDAGSIDDEKELARSVGTPAFWAPELCYEDTNIFEDGKTPKITGALDLWALGITLYCMIYARLPFYALNGIGLHEAACTTEPCCPKTRLVAADTTYEQHVTHTTMPMNSNKRLDYELKFEHVPESLRDLIQKLLIKDPAKRITIPQAKRHPWVLEGMTDVDKWLKSPEIERDSKRILEPNEKEISRAVTKRSIFERTLNAAGRLADSLLGRDKSRKRASSTATSASTSSESITLQSPAGSNASTVGKADRSKEARRTSLRGDEVLQALHKSRENTEHPLAQSQSASPDTKEHPDYFSTGVITSKPSSPRTAPVPDIEIRPKGPERAISSMSTSESIKTVRAAVSERSIDETARESDTLTLPEINIRSRMEGFWEGTTRGLSRLTSRDRRYNSASRSPSASRKSSESEVRAVPSLAVSTTTAAGSFETPEALSSAESRSEPRSTPGNARSPEQSQHSYQPPITSTPSAFEQAQAINYRRHVQEAQRKNDDAAIELQAEVPQTPEDCPPSPDDLTFQKQVHSSTDYAPQSIPNGIIQSAPSASTIASSVDGFGASSVSQSVSDPSFGAISGASSPPNEGFLSAEYKHFTQGYQSHTHTAETEPDFMRTADTVTEHGRPKVATASGKALEQQPYSYTDGDDENDSSDEEGIMMGGPQRR